MEILRPNTPEPIKEEIQGVINTLSRLRQKTANTIPYNIHTVANHLWKDIYDDAQELSMTFKETILNTFNQSYIKNSINKILKKYENRLLITLFCDYAPIGGRFHLHGVIKPFNDGIKYMDKFKREITRIFGKTDIKPIHSRKSYIAYMLKVYMIQVKLTRQEIITNDYRIHNNMVEPIQQEENDIQCEELQTMMLKHIMSKL